MTIAPTLSSVSMPKFRIWSLGLLFFLAATPFELTQSGYAYIVKSFAMAVIVSYAVLQRGARTGLIHPIVGIILVLFFANNIFSWTDRAAIAIASIFFGTILGQARSERWDRDLYSIVSMFIFVHFAALTFSGALFYSTGNVIDLHGMVFPEASRAEAFDVIGRLSGLHTEPGTYSQWTLISLYLLALIRGKLFTFWHALVASSVLLTFSLWGVLALGTFILAFLIEAVTTGGLKGKFRAILRFVAFLVTGAVVVFSISPEIRQVALDFFVHKGSLVTDSGLDKLRASLFFRDNLTSVLFFGEPLYPGFCPNCISPQDAGVGQNAIYYFGLLFFGALILTIFVRITTRWNLSFALLLLLIVSWKAHVYEPLLWIVFGYILRGPSKFFFDTLGKIPTSNDR